MKTWANYVAAGQAKPEEEAVVRKAYAQYQASMLAVIEASRIATASGDQSGLQNATARSVQLQAALINAINSFLPTAIQPTSQ